MGWCHQNDDIGHWLHPTSQEQWTTTHGQDIHCKTPRTWRWGWNTSCTTETLQTILGGYEEELHTDHIALPLGWHSPTPRGCPWVDGTSRGKREQVWTFSSPSILGVLLWFCHRGITGEFVELDHWESDWMEKRGGLIETRAWILASQVPTSCT